MAKEPDSKSSPEARSDGNSYGGNYAGYSPSGYGYGEGGSVQRSFQDYLLILRERIWYVIVVFLVVFSSTLIYTLGKTKIYQSVATVQVFRRDPTVVQVQQVVDNDIRSVEDLNTQVKVLESARIVQRVADRLTGDDLRAFLAPYEKTDTAFVAEILMRNRKIIQQRLSLMVAIAYQHPDRFVAATVANLFAEEYLQHNSQIRIDDSHMAVRELKNTVEDQQKRVEQISHELQAYKEKNNMVSLDARKDVVGDSLKTSNAEVQRTGQILAAAETHLNQMTEQRAKGADMTDLPFIANQSLIVQLTQQLALQKITLSAVRERVRALHPDMIKATKAVAETEREYAKAIDTACKQVEAEYESALRNHRQAQQEFEKKRKESLEFDRAALDYNDKEREFRTEDQILQTIVARRTETAMTSNIATQNARIVDHAGPAPENKPEYPKVGLNLGLGLVGGVTLGLAFAFFVAFIDDRVKSSFDIEGVVGLPLIGIIPQIKRMDQVDKAQIVVNNADRQVAEAFLTLHSSLRLKDESKHARCILTTSTIPGEGKSFTTTNLALTFAAHGEKVLVVDCDLRKPNIHKSFRVENLKGVIDVCTGKATIADVVVRNLQPNFDILPAGGRAKNPTQILNSKAFETMISDLRKSYDRIFIDTPPLAAVSDALIILPLVDGSIFTIYFNKVRRKAAQFAAKRLLDSNVPNFGAVLNGLNLAVSGYYYAQYYDKSYKDYYIVMSKGDDSEAR